MSVRRHDTWMTARSQVWRKGLVACLILGLGGASVAEAQQASLVLKNSDMSFCYRQQNEWTLTKTNDAGTPPVASGTTVNWTVTATKVTTGPNEICAVGYVSVHNGGSAPATIGNIVVNLQRRQLNKWVSASADVANASLGDSATVANILASASQEDPSSANYDIVGAKGTFTENSASGMLEFTDADSNTIWAITPQQTIPAGATVNLFFKASFNNTLLAIPPGASLRTEAIVTFGNAGTRGGGGASASNIDINGNGSTDPDEANVRSVPTRLTRNLPALEQCNDTVQLTDALTATTGASYSDVIDLSGLLSGLSISQSGAYQLSAKVSGTGSVTNTVNLNGTDTFVTIQVPTGEIDPLTGLPVFEAKQIPCCIGADLTASSQVDVTKKVRRFNDGDYCTYRQAGYGAPPNGNNPGALLTNNFAGVYPTGVEVGIIGAGGFSMTFTSASAVTAYLPVEGQAGVLTGDLIDPTSSASRVFGGEVLALQISGDFSDAGVTNNLTGKFGDLKFANLVDGSVLSLWTLTAAQAAALNGQTVRQVLAAANTRLGGGSLPAYVGSINDLDQLVRWLNKSFDSCFVTAGATSFLRR